MKLGHVSTEGTTLQGNASRHKAMSYGDMKKEVERLREEIAALVTQASQQDAQDEAALGSRRGDALPAEWARREDRLATIEAAMHRLEACAKADAEAERTRRAAAAAERQRTGKTRRGTAPTAVDETPEDNAQIRFTDPELGIMQTNNKGWEYCGNAQVRVEAAYQIIVAGDVTAEASDTQHAVPMAPLTMAQLEQAGIKTPKDATGAAQKIPGTYDSGYYSATAAAGRAVGICSLHGHGPSATPWAGSCGGCGAHHSQGAHGSESTECGRACSVGQTQSDRGTRGWAEQSSARFPPVCAAWRGQDSG